MALWAPRSLSQALVIIISKNVVWNSFQHPKSSSKTSLKSSNLLVTCSPYPYGFLVAPLFIDSIVKPSLIFWAILLAFGPHELLFSRFSCSFEALQVGPFRLLLEICLFESSHDGCDIAYVAFRCILVSWVQFLFTRSISFEKILGGPASQIETLCTFLGNLWPRWWPSWSLGTWGGEQNSKMSNIHVS